MLKRNVKKKILAMVLIFTLTFAKFAYVTEAMATSIFSSIFEDAQGTGHENVEFDAFFDVDGQVQSEIVSDVNNSELAIKVQVDVFESGYLKHAKVELVEAEEGKGLNFKVRDFEELPVNLQNANEEDLVSIPDIGEIIAKSVINYFADSNNNGIVEELKAIKTMEENNKKRLMLYREYENDIKEAYDDLERLIKNWNEED